jgi:hypothetical protein
MSVPIPVCLLRKALTNEMALKDLYNRLKVNFKSGHMLIWGCKHEPRCKDLTDEEFDLLVKKTKEMEDKENEKDY